MNDVPKWLTELVVRINANPSDWPSKKWLVAEEAIDLLGTAECFSCDDDMKLDLIGLLVEEIERLREQLAEADERDERLDESACDAAARIMDLIRENHSNRDGWPPERFIADALSVRDGEIKKLCGILGEVREVDRMHAEDEWARRKVAN